MSRIMQKCRFFFLVDQSHIQAVHIVDAANEEAAIAEASKLLNNRSLIRRSLQ
jgi:hypothetical protein